MDLDDAPPDGPLPVKFTLYRLLQESLANGRRHGGGDGQRVTLRRLNGELLVEVADHGKGFDAHTAMTDGHLGIAGMRQRVEILGGTFSVESAPGEGTLIRASLPLAALEPGDE